jgi:hypothetical protein
VGSEDGIDQALLEAICELLDVKPVPAVLSVATAAHNGTAVVSVLIDDGVLRRGGSAVLGGNRPWSVARAFWAALSGPA